MNSIKEFLPLAAKNSSLLVEEIVRLSDSMLPVVNTTVTFE